MATLTHPTGSPAGSSAGTQAGTPAGGSVPGATSGPGGNPIVGRLVRALTIKGADSPTRLRLASAVTVVVAIALSLGGWYSIDRRDTAIDDAARAASQLIQVQDVRVQVVQADSIASTSYLVGGLEAADQRAEYDARLADAAGGLLVAVQGATSADADELEAVNEQLAVYAGLIEQARANNRQGFPVGAAYQRQAREVATSAVASLRTVEQSTRQRVDDSMERASRASWLLVVTALLVLAALLAGSWWLAMRWRRLINVPLAIAAAIVLLVLTVGSGVNARAVSRAGDAVNGPLSAADLVAQARAAGFDARSSEALTLINRGNGAAYETAWQLSADVVAQALGQACGDYGVGCTAVNDFGAYAESHVKVRELDDGGDWDAAVSLATVGKDVDGNAVSGADPPADFDAFAQSSANDLDAYSTTAADAFDQADDSLGGLRLLVALAGIVIAVLAVNGYGQRLREYR